MDRFSANAAAPRPAEGPPGAAASKKRGYVTLDRKDHFLPQLLLCLVLAAVLLLSLVCNVSLFLHARGDAAAPAESGQAQAATPSAGEAPDNQALSAGDSEPQPEAEQTAASPDAAEPEEETEEEAGDSIEARARELLAEMTLEEKICQLFIVTPELLTGDSPVTRAGSETGQALEEYPVGGIVYFASSLNTREQVTEMIGNTQQYSRLGLFIAVDEEGGRVARVGSNSALGTTSFPAMGTLETEEEAYQVGLTMGTELQELGFNLDFAPVADVSSNPNNSVIGDRAFSDDPEEAAQLAAACVRGLRASGILCTLKHWPGHGDTAGDSHDGAVSTGKTLEELAGCEFLPFQSGIAAGANFVMAGHISCPAVTGDDLPASLSPVLIGELLRGELGFEGVIITDSMQMQAITDHYSSGEAAVAALQAGVDMILMPASLSRAVGGIADAVEDGTLTEARIDESVLRVLSAKLEAGILTD